MKFESEKTIYSQIGANRIKTVFLMAVFTVFITAVVYIFTQALGYQSSSGLFFVGIALVVTGIMNFVAYYNSDKMVMKMAGAQLVDVKTDPQLYKTVENLSIGSGLPMPKIYIIPDEAPNAFATGRDPNHASIAATTGLIAIMNKTELEGVLAHELSHIGNYDTRLMTVVVILVGIIAMLADFFGHFMFFGGGDDDRDSKNSLFIVLGILAAILAPIAAQLIQLAVSRKREFLADATGSLLTRYPDGLADALEKISTYERPVKSATPATAHLYIANPLGTGHFKKSFANLFSTHPPVEERIKILREM
mgnify:CR=1 FL=1